MERVRLCVNIDHVATVRNARGTVYPDPAHLAVLALNAGADGIVAHLREDRRHVVERDVRLLRSLCPYFGFEFAMADDIVSLARELRPDLAMLVPERREEVTTETGLDVVGERDRVAGVVAQLREDGISVSLFVDPVEAQLEAAAAVGAQFVELHTGPYSDAESEEATVDELQRLRVGAAFAERRGLRVNAGHGLRVDNVGAVAAIPQIEELSIGHAVVARALSLGIEGAVREMREAIRGDG